MPSYAWYITSAIIDRKTHVFFKDDNNNCVNADGVELPFDRPVYFHVSNPMMPYSLVSSHHARILSYGRTNGVNSNYFYDVYLNPPEDSTCQSGTPDLSGTSNFAAYSNNRGYFFQLGSTLRYAVNTSEWYSVRDFVIAIRPKDAPAGSELKTTGSFYFQTHTIPSKTFDYHLIVQSYVR